MKIKVVNRFCIFSLSQHIIEFNYLLMRLPFYELDKFLFELIRFKRCISRLESNRLLKKHFELEGLSKFFCYLILNSIIDRSLYF